MNDKKEQFTKDAVQLMECLIQLWQLHGKNDLLLELVVLQTGHYSIVSSRRLTCGDGDVAVKSLVNGVENQKISYFG